MAYIIKNTAGLLNTRFTDTGRKKLSQGRLNISYFQVGDSEVAYGVIPGFNHALNNILAPAYNAQNSTQEPETNKAHVKYPFYLSNSSGNTYGIPVQDAQIASVYNTAEPRGFFTGQTYAWSALTSGNYSVNSQYVIDLCLCSGNVLVLDNSLPCGSATGTPQVGDFVTIYYDGMGGCGEIVYPYPILTYNVTAATGNQIYLDRPIPNYLDAGCCGYARVFFYPSGMTQLYDYNTPADFIPCDVTNFECICDNALTDVKIWNLSIPWSVNPAGVDPSVVEDYTKYASATYLGTKEYLGYQESSGQTFWVEPTMTAETTDTFYYNSFDEILYVEPNDQKTIGIVHYTNNSVENYYGEKFAMTPFDPYATSSTGFAKNFKVSLPWLMWHKSSTCAIGETFYVDPDVGTGDYFHVKYMKSKPNEDMNNPGLRYYHLWDTHINSDGNPSRVGKVFPDLKLIVFDDEEIVAAMSYKSNRNWTLPAPQVSLITPNLCDLDPDDFGTLGDENEYMYVTYRFNSANFTNSLHCNYYVKVQGPKKDCNLVRQNVAVRFGNEFCFMSDCSCCFVGGYSADEFKVLAQIVTGSTTQPNPTLWREIDFTTLVSNQSTGCVSSSAMTANTFTISYNQYYSAPFYNLDNYIDLPTLTGEENKLNFGDEYYFYGNIETDIQATIYEMKYLCNLTSNQFVNSSNPTWTKGTKNYITEIGLFDDEKDLIVITKLQSPILRQGTQQFAIKLDF